MRDRQGPKKENKEVVSSKNDPKEVDAHANDQDLIDTLETALLAALKAAETDEEMKKPPPRSAGRKRCSKRTGIQANP